MMTDANRKSPRALIIGGSMAGLFSALLLRKLGWQVDVFERSSVPFSSRGAGIATHPELVTVLQSVGVDPGDALGVPIIGRCVFDSDGSLAGTFDLPQVMTSWGRLFRLVRVGLPDENYHVGVPFARLVQDHKSVTAIFTDGQSERADLLIAADGISSTVRGQLLPHIVPRYAGYVAWRGMASESDMSSVTLDALGERMGFCLPPGEHCLTYPVAGPNEELTPGARRRNFVWYRAAMSETEQAALMTNTDGERQTVSVPPREVSGDAIAVMRKDAREVLSPQVVELVDSIAEPFLQAIVDLECPQVVFGRVAILGDAAFVARPHTGMGVTKAGEDALALANALARTANIDAALSAWQQQCLAYGQRMVRRGRKLGDMVNADRIDPQGDAFGRARGVERAVMMETAVPG